MGLQHGKVCAAESHPEALDGLLLCAAYPMKAIGAGLRVVSVYGTNDGVHNYERFEAGKQFLPPDAVEHAIEGGNHGQFGNYGDQRGDRAATITAAAQQAETVEVFLSAIQDR